LLHLIVSLYVATNAQGAGEPRDHIARQELEGLTQACPEWSIVAQLACGDPKIAGYFLFRRE